MRQIIFLLILVLIIAACNPQASPTATLENTRLPATATLAPSSTLVPSHTPLSTATTAPTTAPSATPMSVEDLPAIEILSGEANTCSVAEDYSVVIGFNVNYYETTTVNRVHYRLEDAEGNMLSEDDTVGENKDGEEGWGFYPLAYNVPENTVLSMTIEVYESEDETAILTSRSSLSYNCTTGETISQSFERLGR